jgi:serine/threonine protein phosphatase PrpC
MSPEDEGDERDARPGITEFTGPDEFPPPSTTVQVAFGAQSRRGRSRLVNEDHYVVFRLGRHQSTLLSSLPEEVFGKEFDEYGYAMVVADGLGTVGAGESASRLAITTLVHLVRHFGKWNLRIDRKIAQEILARAEAFYRHVDSTVVHQALTGPIPGLQTTLTATFGAGRDLFFAHVGHSRAYLFRQGQLMRLTRDHTIGRNQTTTVPAAPLVDVNATARDLKHILTNTIGMRGSVGPDIDLERFRLADKDVVLVCTNGLTDAVDEKSIANVLASHQSPADESQALVELALAAGAEDDATALVAEYHIPE